MSIEASVRVWKHSKQSGSKLLLLVALADYTNAEGWAWPSISSLCERTRLGERYVQKMLKEIAEAGEIEIHQRKNQSNFFRILLHEGGEPECTRGVNYSSGGGEPQFGRGVNYSAPNPLKEPLENRKGKTDDEKKPKERKDKADIQTVRDFFSSLQLPQSDADYFFHTCEGNGWTNKGNPMKDWRAKVRAWHVANYFPSQKKQQMLPVNGTPKKLEFRDV